MIGGEAQTMVVLVSPQHLMERYLQPYKLYDTTPYVVNESVNVIMLDMVAPGKVEMTPPAIEIIQLGGPIQNVYPQQQYRELYTRDVRIKRVFIATTVDMIITCIVVMHLTKMEDYGVGGTMVMVH